MGNDAHAKNEITNGDVDSTAKPQNTDVDAKTVGVQPARADTIDIDNIADSIADTLPEVQPHAIAQHAENQQKIADYTDGAVDRDGNTFDPAMHITDDHGYPKISEKTGKLIKKRGRKKSGSAHGAASERPESVISTPHTLQHTDNIAADASATSSNDDAARATGVTAANLMITCSMAIFGDEWTPQKDSKTGIDERAHLENAFADYFVATGKTDIPPGWALTFAVGAYSLPRFVKPKTKTRIQRFIEFIARKWHKAKSRKIKRETEQTEKTSSNGQDA